MLEKSELEEIINNDFGKNISNKTLYKYTSLEVGIENILLNGTLKFSHPSIFNDPFDCNEKLLKIRLTKEEKRELFNSIKPKIPSDFRRTVWDQINDQNKYEEYNKINRDRFKISCFSEVSDEILMWSHYAEKHSGICIGFKFNANILNQFVLAPVKYISELKPLDGNAPLNRVIYYWLTTKSERWEYEKEVRAIAKTKNNENAELIKFDLAYVSEIIFGCNISQSSLELAINRLEKSMMNYNLISIKKMEIDDKTFSLKENLIKPLA
ncbi:DUF2971 domain-containing protein [Poritiphilus flavus]|uniref:DUF2971 domain-containing protein n=1 Tax=Poritiphilus flavus TaxID=2697053 RepID=A0A6L9EC26_9FLAO|nr:DUF2971 domain-containing protein [Poritiphilus flavus]NAS12247.1 DUF2971 domain-containing protein [Poritiphilus flavus]